MALTEKYVSRTAAGGGTGLTAGSPLTFTEMVTAINAGTEAGSRFNVLNDGTAYTRSASDTISGSGTATSPVVIRGYTSTIGDGYLGRTNGNGPLILTNFPTVAYNSTFRLNITGAFILLETVLFKGNVSAGTVTTVANCCTRAIRCVNASTNASAIGLAMSIGPAYAFDSEGALTGASGGRAAIESQSNGVSIVGCRAFVTSSVPCILITGANNRGVIAFNTCYGSGGSGIAMRITTGTPVIMYNTCVGCSGDGIDIITGATGVQFIIGNMSTDNGGYGVNLESAAVASLMAYNRTRDNTSGAVNLGTDWVSATSWGNVTSGSGSSSDYVNFAGNNYNLLATSPATSAGVPQYASIGALQRSQTSSGGGLLRHPGMTGGTNA